MEKSHLWEGEWLDDNELNARLEHLSTWAAGQVTRPLDLQALLAAVDLLSQQLKNKHGSYEKLKTSLLDDGKMSETEVIELLTGIAVFLDRDQLEKKLIRELGSTRPFSPVRIDEADSIFEAWAPLGVLVHVAPSNAASVAPLSVLEGLLSGNVNILKTSGSEGLFPPLFLKALFDCDLTGTLKNFVVAARVSSKRKEVLEKLFSVADGMAVWGGEEGVDAVKKIAPRGARLVDWGHKISFIYLTQWDDEKLLEQAALECCLFEQQACSSPQCLYLDTSDWKQVEEFGSRFAKMLDRVSAQMPRNEPSREESAEITLVTELTREESCFSEAKVIEDPKKTWRVLLDSRSPLAASPLYRTIWVKPLPRKNIVATLRPMRQYLQTVGLACGLDEIVELSGALTAAGAIRIRCVGAMAGSYDGEPHDGVYALQRYCRRVSFQLPGWSAGISSFIDLQLQAPPHWAQKPKIMTKADFQYLQVDDRDAHLFFKSGGSSGEPKMSVFRYEDYHEQMRMGAEGLYAAGLEPAVDRNMNLFFSGALYGGFLSIFSVLEELRAVQFPMAAQMDFPMVCEAIIRNKVNVLLGMPSYLIQLFEKCAGDFEKYRGVKKIFYGGEHFNDAQRKFLKERFGVSLIKSIGYGSVDAGPLGYQCRFCDGGVHHLHQRLQYLEILNLEKDEPVKGSEIGRLIFTSKVRKRQKIDRYEIGDVGQWIEVCPCGRKSPRFNLLGRSGDVMRVGSIYLNYQKFVHILGETFQYSGPVQLEISHEGLKEKMTVRVSKESGLDSKKIYECLNAGYDDLREIVEIEKLMILTIQLLESDRFERTKGSGKLVRIIDLRKR